MEIRLYSGDNQTVLPTIEENSVDSIVTDPPYELGFMGKSWDRSGIAYSVALWRECYGGSRTYHRLACAIEESGFDIRDQIMWIYGSGFPKSHNLPGGLGTALKPAHEPIAVARKPFKSTVAENVQQYGTGAFNIDACRVEGPAWARSTPFKHDIRGGGFHSENSKVNIPTDPQTMNEGGRWPANIIHDGSQEVIDSFPIVNSGKPSGTKSALKGDIYGSWKGGMPVTGYGDSGSAARFFYGAKADRDDRNEGLKKSRSPVVATNATMREVETANWSARNGNHHPTVKPTDLMQYLCRLVTPKGGTVLDPFMGSGSTGKGAVKEGFGFVGIELQEEYFPIAKARIEHAAAKYKPQMKLFN